MAAAKSNNTLSVAPTYESGVSPNFLASINVASASVATPPERRDRSNNSIFSQIIFGDNKLDEGMLKNCDLPDNLSNCL